MKIERRYIHALLFGGLIATASLQSCTVGGNGLAQCVNPFIGTDYTGNTYPGAQVPHGLVQLSPDNGLPG